MSCFISIKEKDSRDFHHILHIYRYVIGDKKFREFFLRENVKKKLNSPIIRKRVPTI